MLRHILPAPKAKVEFARVLRRYRQTSAERRLWTQIRNRKLHGLKFRRQVPLGPFVADFLCVKHKLIVELDGDSHDHKRAYDQRRTLYFRVRGYHVIRYANDQLYVDLEGVLEDIVSKATGKTKTQTSSLPAGES